MDDGLEPDVLLDPPPEVGELLLPPSPVEDDEVEVDDDEPVTLLDEPDRLSVR